MQFTTVVLASAVAATAYAAPVASSELENQYFGLITIRSGSDVQNSGVQAAKRSLFVNLPKQNASCDADTNFATFYLKDTELFLYAASATPQTIFVDRSGMGQGKVGYTTGAEPLGKNWENKGWVLDDGHLTFNGTSLQACPNSIDGAWSLWLSGVTNPAGNSDCLGVASRVQVTDSPIGCSYSQ